MPAPASTSDFLELVRKSGVLDEKRLDMHIEQLRETGQMPTSAAKLAAALVRDGLLTNFQVEQLIQGKWRRFTIGKYKILERLGFGGMGSVFLCEHVFMRRYVAVKVLPPSKSGDPSSLDRFYREARAVAALDHPNIVHAYDIDKDDAIHFIVMEYVDGPSLQEIVHRSGPVSLERACHYISQAAEGLEHASAAGIVHRDIKPGNILVDRSGVVKILDMGLARIFSDDEDQLTKKYDENVLGTADYLAPEQADDSHAVDVRADIYALGGTFYFLLTGKTPFGEGTTPQKLMWHRTRKPKSISSYRSDVPSEIQAIVDRLMAKDPEQRFQTGHEIVAALSPWTQSAIPPPAENELPRLSPAVSGSSLMGNSTPTTGSTGPASASGKKTWQYTGSPTAAKSPSSKSDESNKSPSPTLNPASPQPGPQTPRRGAPRPAAPRPLPRVAAGTKTAAHASTWPAVSSDTAEAAARGDTPPLVPGRHKARKRIQPWWKRLTRRQLLALTLAATLGTLSLIGFLCIFLFWLARA